MIKDHGHSLPDLPAGMKAGDSVQVRVKPHNTYGERQAGDVFVCPAAEWQGAHRALELLPEGDPTPATPTSKLLTIPTAEAKRWGLPTGEAAIGLYEVMPWPADAAAKGMKRREVLEAEIVHLRGGGSTEAQDFAAAFGWEEDDGDPTAWIKERLPTIKKTFADAHHANQRLAQELGETGAAATRLRADLAKESEYLKEQERTAELLRKDLGAAQEQLTAAQGELAGIRAEMEQLKAAAQQAPSAPPLPKGKKE